MTIQPFSGSWWRIKWPMILLFGTMVIIIVDRSLPLTKEIVRIDRSDEFTTRLSSRGMRTVDRWSVVHLTNGQEFQTQRAVDNFRVATEMEVLSTAILGSIVAYRSTVPGRNSWYGPESDDEDLRPFPYVIALAALALLYSWRNIETRWLITGILGICLFVWCLGLGSTNMFRLFSW